MLITHLWKEWREQRTLLLACSAMLLLIAIGYGSMAPARMLPSDIGFWFAAIALGAGFVALAGARPWV